mgnify:CR=1 FL=1
MLPKQYEKITTRGVVGMILARLETGPSAWVMDLCMQVTSDQASEEYGWLGASPALRKFMAGRQPAELRENSFVISNEDYEGSITIKSKDMRRDKFGMINVRVNQLSDRANDHPAKLLSELIENGEATACYDGQYYFDTDHEEGESGALSNDISYSVVSNTAPTADEMANAITTAIVQMYTFKDDRGEPMNQNATEFTVMVPAHPALMSAALKAKNILLGTGGATAELAALKSEFTINIVINPRLTWTTKFATFRTDEAAKPFILQQEDIPAVVSLGEGTEYEQLKKEQLFGIDWTGNVGFGYWQYGVLTSLDNA